MLHGRLLVSALALFAAAASGAARDLKPVRKIPPAPSWTGFYAGPTLGWARGGSSGYYQGTGGPVPPPTLITPKNPKACDFATDVFIYVYCALLDPITPGAVAGYNFQLGMIVAGFEGDIGWIGRHSPVIPAADGSARWDKFGVTWTSHLRGRIGYPIGNYLPYIAGGFALAGFNAAHFRSDATGNILYTANDTRAGYSIGGGVEVANLFANALPGWVFRAEYVYDYFRNKRYDWVPGMRYSVFDLTMNTVRAGATYRFSPR